MRDANHGKHRWMRSGMMLACLLLGACSSAPVASADSASGEQNASAENAVGENNTKKEDAEKTNSDSGKGAGDASAEAENNTEDAGNDTDSLEADTDILVAYFSCTGNTESVAKEAVEILGADVYEITAADPYTEEDLDYYSGGRADQEQEDPNVRPEIEGSVPNMEDYDVVLLGYPIWHEQAPRIISTFLESYDFSDKKIVPFCTSGGSGVGSSADNLHTLCDDSTTWEEGIRFGSNPSQDAIREWLEDTVR